MPFAIIQALTTRFSHVGGPKLCYELKPTASKMGVGINISRILKLLVHSHLRGFIPS